MTSNRHLTKTEIAERIAAYHEACKDGMSDVLFAGQIGIGKSTLTSFLKRHHVRRRYPTERTAGTMNHMR